MQIPLLLSYILLTKMANVFTAARPESGRDTGRRGRAGFARSRFDQYSQRNLQHMQDAVQQRALQLKEDLEGLEKELIVDDVPEAAAIKSEPKKFDGRASFKNLGNMILASTRMGFSGNVANKTKEDDDAEPGTRKPRPRSSMFIKGPALLKGLTEEKKPVQEEEKKKTIFDDVSFNDDLASSLSEAGGDDIISDHGTATKQRLSFSRRSGSGQSLTTAKSA